MRPYLRQPWTNSCQIRFVRVFHHVQLKYGNENAKMQQRKFDEVILRYSIMSMTINTTDIIIIFNIRVIVKFIINTKDIVVISVNTRVIIIITRIIVLIIVNTKVIVITIVNTKVIIFNNRVIIVNLRVIIDNTRNIYLPMQWQHWI